MGNLVADAMLDKYAAARGGLHELGRPRADLPCDPPSAGEGSCEITLGELFAVLPFGNATVVATLTGAQMKAAFINGFSPACNSAINTGRFPQIAGLRATFHCSGTAVVIDGIWKSPDGAGRDRSADRGDTVRFVTNDFMYTGGDGYTVFTRHRRAAAGRPAARRRPLHRVVTRAGRAGRRGPDYRSLAIPIPERLKGRLDEPALSCRCNGVSAHRRLRHAAAEPHHCTQERPLSRK